ncbi:MAG TPA: MauE/DoxX family redox-associated membrane protein [Thermoanaerobaculia bacterium]|nr:MauE/DoxX family redox-associated membrane protein [Thermoanaerobaculia bacterium]
MSLAAVRLVAQLALGLVFLLSALGKLRHPAAFLRGVAEFEILPVPLAKAFGAVVIPAEAFLAAAHLTGWGLRVAVPLGIALLLAFTTAVTVNLRRNRDLLCHCFDSLGGERVSARSVAQLVLLLAAELLLLSQPPGLVYPQKVATLGDLALAAVWAVFSLLAGLWLLRADEVIQLFRRHRCKTCSQAPEARPVS